MVNPEMNKYIREENKLNNDEQLIKIRFFNQQLKILSQFLQINLSLT